jgi:hypothetical protein
MNFKLSIERSAPQGPARNAAKDPEPMQCVSSAVPNPVKFSDVLGELGFTAIRRQKLREMPRAAAAHPEMGAGSLIKRAFSWLNGNCSTPKRLRVLETVTLGDKRMVAVIQADGRRFLVGGGPSGVSLLTALDREPRHDVESMAGLGELAG